VFRKFTLHTFLTYRTLLGNAESTEIKAAVASQSASIVTRAACGFIASRGRGRGRGGNSSNGSSVSGLGVGVLRGNSAVESRQGTRVVQAVAQAVKTSIGGEGGVLPEQIGIQGSRIAAAVEGLGRGKVVSGGGVGVGGGRESHRSGNDRSGGLGASLSFQTASAPTCA
jgi:hypothetical protein